MLSCSMIYFLSWVLEQHTNCYLAAPGKDVSRCHFQPCLEPTELRTEFLFRGVYKSSLSAFALMETINCLNKVADFIPLLKKKKSRHYA